MMSAVNNKGETTPAAIIVSGDEETRVLLRSLLQLFQVRVDGEAEAATKAIELLRVHRSTLAVVDANLTEAGLIPLFSQARSRVPGIRIVLVAPTARPPNLPNEAPQQPDVVLLRPFRIRQFADALVPNGSAGMTPSS